MTIVRIAVNSAQDQAVAGNPDRHFENPQDKRLCRVTNRQGQANQCELILGVRRDDRLKIRVICVRQYIIPRVCTRCEPKNELQTYGRGIIELSEPSPIYWVWGSYRSGRRSTSLHLDRTVLCSIAIPWDLG